MADLHTEINELIEARLRKALEAGETINLREWVIQFAESLADMIVFGAPEEEQPELIEHAREQIDYFIRQKQKMFVKDGKRQG